MSMLNAWSFSTAITHMTNSSRIHVYEFFTSFARRRKCGVPWKELKSRKIDLLATKPTEASHARYDGCQDFTCRPIVNETRQASLHLPLTSKALRLRLKRLPGINAHRPTAGAALNGRIVQQRGQTRRASVGSRRRKC
jgi:hypothetical protein